MAGSLDLLAETQRLGASGSLPWLLSIDRIHQRSIWPELGCASPLCPLDMPAPENVKDRFAGRN